jgi:mannitol-1-/sugar-/sorbitol-6-phosphatase
VSAEPLPTAPSPALSGRTFAAVFFDLDDTLVDSTASVERCWRQWALEFGVRLPGVLEHGLPARTKVSRYLSADQFDAGGRRIEELEEADTGGITAVPGAREAIAMLPPERFAIVSSCGGLALLEHPHR